MLLPLHQALSPLGYRRGGPAVHPRWDGLAAGWKVDESSDASVSVPRADVLWVHTLTDVNTVESAVGLIGNAAKFVAAEATRLQNASFSLDTTSDFTVVMHIDDARNAKIALWLDNGTDIVLQLFILSTTSSRARLYNTAGGNTTRDTTGGVATGFNCAIFGLRSGGLFNSLNGNPTSVTAFSGTPRTASRISLGGDFGTGQQTQGLIDEVYVFTRGLSDADIADMYNGGAGRSYPN